ncbi:MAG: hypothetical protein CVU62_07050 [Deltaproteobacteria bacterium HGW-Deltaproteobacteria-2]|jgi:hypothetical protein|nr:MAG: hypothetical protein CVU62_07050 [Deltaproteobacteria bacterium HGW-Deltaproteobacteria-2]
MRDGNDKRNRRIATFYAAILFLSVYVFYFDEIYCGQGDLNSAILSVSPKMTKTNCALGNPEFSQSIFL